MPRIAWALLAILAVAGLSLWILDRDLKAKSYVRVTKSQFDKEIRDQLPLGTPRAVIEAFLEKRAIAHSYIEDSAVRPDDNRTELGIIRDSSSSG